MMIMIFIQELGCYQVNMGILSNNFRRGKLKLLLLNQRLHVKEKVYYVIN
jgi:hypothetical protein